LYIPSAKKLTEYVRDDVGNLAVFTSSDFIAEALKRFNLTDKILTEPDKQGGEAGLRAR